MLFIYLVVRLFHVLYPNKWQNNNNSQMYTYRWISTWITRECETNQMERDMHWISTLLKAVIKSKTQWEFLVHFWHFDRCWDNWKLTRGYCAIRELNFEKTLRVGSFHDEKKFCTRISLHASIFLSIFIDYYLFRTCRAVLWCIWLSVCMDILYMYEIHNFSLGKSKYRMEYLFKTCFYHERSITRKVFKIKIQFPDCLVGEFSTFGKSMTMKLFEMVLGHLSRSYLQPKSLTFIYIYTLDVYNRINCQNICEKSKCETIDFKLEL